MFLISSFSLKNNIYTTKPNEDNLFIIEDISAFGVLDGVSRDAVNGAYPEHSPSYDVAHLICDVISNELISQSKIDKIHIEKAILKANDTVLQYNTRNELIAFPAGAVGVFCMIKDHTMHYSYIGDCFGFIVRNNLAIPFTHKQTSDVIENYDKFSLDFIRTNICNNPKHPYGYGVINGSISAEDFIISGSLELKSNDIIFLSSDGCENVLDSATIDDLVNLSAEDLIKKYCTGVNQDDRTLIKIKI